MYMYKKDALHRIKESINPSSFAIYMEYHHDSPILCISIMTKSARN